MRGYISFFLKSIKMKKIKTQFTISEIPLEKLKDAQAGVLFKAIKCFAETGEELPLEYPLNILFERIRNELREPIKKKKINKDKEIWFKTLKDFGINEVLVNDFIKVRTQKRLAFTETALNDFIKEIEKTNFDKNQLLRYIINKSWGSFRSTWQVDLSKQSSYANKINNELDELFKK